MVNKDIFGTGTPTLPPKTDTVNDAGGVAYKLDAKHALAQMAATGVFGNTYYTKAETQLGRFLDLIQEVNDDEYLAKLAVYAREKACMKDMPAALIAALSTQDTELTHKVFHRVIDNGRVLRTLFQMVRSGQFGRKGLSSSLQRAFQSWLNEASVGKLLSASIGKDPSLRDVLRMARPNPKDDNERRALYGWLTDKEVEKWAPATPADLPETIELLNRYRAAVDERSQHSIVEQMNGRVRWDLLADAAKGPLVWKAIARQMGPQALRMNLNTLERHDVLKDQDMVRYVAAQLVDPEKVKSSKQFPYQYFAAYINASDTIPQKIKQALHTAAEIACGNVPELPGPIVIGLDTSGSMGMAATGWSRGHTSAMTCKHVAALFAAAILRRNPDSIVIPFDTQAYDCKVDPGDTILSLSARLSKYGGGGTNCALPLQKVNQELTDRPFAGMVLVSDNESWIDGGRGWTGTYARGTGVMNEWETFVQNQQRLGVTDPKLVCIDIQPSANSQAPERDEILNVGGFSDAVFNVVSGFLSPDQDRFVSEVEAIEL